MLYWQGFLKYFSKFTGKTCAGVSFLIKLQAAPRLYSMAQKFTCEFCKIFANSYFVEHPRTAASEVNDLVYIKFYTYKKRCGDLLLCYFLKRDLIDFLPCYYWKYCYFNFLISLYESLFSQWYILSTIRNF